MRPPTCATPTLSTTLTSTLATSVTAALVLGTAACSVDSLADGGEVEIVVGYQSKTINTVTAGTLLRAQGYLEDELDELGESTGETYRVRWQDYDTGAPITAGMMAGKIDIGSMGDYPLLINGSRSLADAQAPTSMLSVTGYGSAGALNGIVVDEDSPLREVKDLEGADVSASVGSAGHGLLVRALKDAGVDPGEVDVQNQQPQIGASALESGQVDALSQFVAWPALLVQQGGAKLLYNGADSATPTLHGVVASDAFTEDNPEVTQAFLRAQLEASDFLRDNPLEAAQIVGDNADLPPEVVYLYNGPGGTAFDPALREDLVEQLGDDVPYLESIGEFDDLTPADLDDFVDPEPLRSVYEDEDRVYSGASQASADLSPIPTDGAPAAGELWVEGEDATRPVATADELLREVARAGGDGSGDGAVRAAYVLDHDNGARWYAEHSVWVRDGGRHLPFSTAAGADRYVSAHAGASIVDYDTALKEAA